MTSDPDITRRLAHRLRDERKRKGLSLDALSRLSGVSRSMISQIERGESSPTVASLWSLTRALNVDFGGLLDASGDAERNIRDIQRAGQTPVIAGTGRGCLIRILSRPEDVGQTEIYELLFQPDGLLDSAPHRPGCTEYLTVLEGRLSLQSGGEAAELATGDTIRYRADVDHRIAAPDTARAILVVKDA